MADTGSNTYLIRTAEQHLAAAKRWRDKAEKMRRKDDGKAWDMEMNARASEARAELARTGGYRIFPALFDLNGDVLPAVPTKEAGKETITFIMFGSDALDARPVGSFTTSQNRDRKMARKLNAASGYYVGTVKVPMVVSFEDHAPLTSTRNKGRVVVRPAVEVFSPEAVVVDNGR